MRCFSSAKNFVFEIQTTFNDFQCLTFHPSLYVNIGNRVATERLGFEYSLLSGQHNHPQHHRLRLTWSDVNHRHLGGSQLSVIQFHPHVHISNIPLMCNKHVLYALV